MQIGILGGNFPGPAPIAGVDGKEQFPEDLRDLSPVDLVDDKDVLFQLFLFYLCL